MTVDLSQLYEDPARLDRIRALITGGRTLEAQKAIYRTLTGEPVGARRDAGALADGLVRDARSSGKIGGS